MTLKQMLEEMLSSKASDLHLRVGVKPYLRTDGVLRSIADEPITAQSMQEIMKQILTEEQYESLLRIRRYYRMLERNKGKFNKDKANKFATGEEDCDEEEGDDKPEKPGRGRGRGQDKDKNKKKDK